MRTLWLWGFVGAAIFYASTSLANGRFPRASMVIEDPSNPSKLTIAATYGLLVTEDRGKHWYYACDQAFAFQLLVVDAMVAAVADGSLLVGSWTTIAKSGDRACNWSKVYSPPIADASSYASVDDFTVITKNRNQVVAAVTTFQKVGANIVQLVETIDGGSTWNPLGKPLPAARVHTVDVDPTDPQRIYATGFTDSFDEDAPELFLRSTDRGGTWSVTTIPGTNAYASAWIAGIHPRDGNKVFVRTEVLKRRAGEVDRAGDALLYSEDAGATWVTLLRPGGLDFDVAGARLLGFALSPDGETVLAGYGDAFELTRVVDPDDRWKGIYKSSSDGQYSFGTDAPDAPTPIAKGSVSCLRWTSAGIYACMMPKDEPQNLTFTRDPNFYSSSLTILMRLNEVLGPPPCCAGRASGVCDWRTDCKALGACDSGAPSRPQVCDDAGDDGIAGAGGSGGGMVLDASAGGSGIDGGTADEKAVGSNACGCRLLPNRATPRRSVALFTMLVVAASRRRKRQSNGYVDAMGGRH